MMIQPVDQEFSAVQVTRLAGVLVPCPDCDHTYENDATRRCGCKTCGDKTGLVPLFGKEVREPCRGQLPYRTGQCLGCRIHKVDPTYTKEWKQACGGGCQGRGWTATKDGWAWWDAAWDFLACLNPESWSEFLKDWQKEWFTSKEDNPSPEVAFFTALERVVDAISGRVWPNSLEVALDG